MDNMDLPLLRHLFTPHHTNNHRAKILHPTALYFLLLIFLVGQILLNIFLGSSPSVLGFASNISVEKVIELTNLKRQERGLPALAVNSKLSQAAGKKAEDMFANNYWAHNSPTGKQPWSFFKEVGYQYTFAGENLARDFMESSEVVEAWMNSPSHRDNIVNSNYQEIGLAVVNGTINGAQTTLVVQLFGTQSGLSKPTITQTAPSTSLADTSESKAGRPAQIMQQEPVSSEVINASDSQNKQWPLLSPFWLTKMIALLLLAIVLGALVIDLIFVYQYRIVRLSSRNLSHLIFIATLLVAVILTTPGAII